MKTYRLVIRFIMSGLFCWVAGSVTDTRADVCPNTIVKFETCTFTPPPGYGINSTCSAYFGSCDARRAFRGIDDQFGCQPAGSVTNGYCADWYIHNPGGIIPCLPVMANCWEWRQCAHQQGSSTCKFAESGWVVGGTKTIKASYHCVMPTACAPGF
jgi:hypothetical protein